MDNLIKLADINYDSLSFLVGVCGSLLIVYLFSSFKKIREKKKDSLSFGEQQPILVELNTYLNKLEQKLDSYHFVESSERASLSTELKILADSARQMNRETRHLSSVFEGSIHTQGSWGELILEKVLENAGLQERQHFSKQGKKCVLKSEDGHRLYPDIIVNLPQNRKIIIDSKCPLKAYKRFVKNHDKKDLDLFFRDIKNQIKNLATKDYSGLSNIDTCEYVCLFFPIQSALNLLLEKDPGLYDYAWSRGVVLTGPYTLVPVLRTVKMAWVQREQSRNTQEIVAEAKKMHQKLVSYIKDFNKLGEQIERSNRLYDECRNRLAYGRGNIISRCEKLQELGVETKDKVEDIFEQKVS